MNAARDTDCPHRSMLERLGTEDWDAGDQESLELHIESCELCQSVLQDLASSSRFDLSAVMGAAADRLPSVAPELPGFRIERELGRGGGSVVYLAEDLSTSRNVAIKLIPGGWTRGSALRSRWLEEVRVAAQMQHYNIVRLYRVEETLHWFLLVFEYISGGTLRDRASQPVSPVDLAKLMVTIAQAVEQIHKTGVLHLDLKPSNVLVDSSAGNEWNQIVPKVSDFGIARWNQTTAVESSPGMHAMGTPAYMAPEQVTGTPGKLSPATDVYGLGGILYTMLTGHPPFEGDTATGILSQVIANRIRPPQDLRPNVSVGLAAIALRCLRKNPRHRYPTPEELASAIQTWMESESSESSEPITSSGRSKRWRAWLAAPAIVMLFAASVIPALRHLKFNNETGPSQSDGPGKSDLSLAELVEEIAEEPAAFDVARASRLVLASQRYTDEILEQQPAPIDQWLRFGVLQQRSSERFTASRRDELYPAAEQLLQNSVKLLERTVRSHPGDQAALLELVAARFSQSLKRIQFPRASARQISQHCLSCASDLLATAAQVVRIEDRRHRVFWISRILDQYRCTCLMARWQGDAYSVQQLGDWHQQYWELMNADQHCVDLNSRHAMMRHAQMKIDNEQGHVAILPEDGWVFPENRKVLQKEMVYILLANTLFDAAAMINEAPEARIPEEYFNRAINGTIAFMKEQHIDPDLLPGILHEDLIRPIATLSTIYRVDSQMQQAESVQHAYESLCAGFEQFYPNHVDVHLAASEACLQAWKNEIRRGHDSNAVAALRASHREAQTALDIAPDSERARFQVADRIKRLTRLQTAN